MRSTADLQAIKTELATDPTGLGDYLAHVADNDEHNAKALSMRRDSIRIQRRDVSVSELAAAINLSEFKAIAADDREWIVQVALRPDASDMTQQSEVRLGLFSLFPNNTQTGAAIRQLSRVRANRVNEMADAGLLEVGGLVTPSDIANARNA